MEDKCPFCGAEDEDGYFFCCGTSRQPHKLSAGKIFYNRNTVCYESQLQAQAARLEEAEKVKDYLTRLFQSCAPQCIPEDNLLYLCTQIDNYIAGRNIRLEEAVEIIREGTMLGAWPGTAAMELKAKAQAFLSQDPALMRGENMTNWPEKAGQPYRPANGTDGMIFMECWCEKCCHDTEEKPCDIIGLSMAFDIGHPMYPKEWVYDAEGLPCCTKFEQEPKDEVS